MGLGRWMANLVQGGNCQKRATEGSSPDLGCNLLVAMVVVGWDGALEQSPGCRGPASVERLYQGR